MDKNQILNLLKVYEKLIEDHKREINHYTFLSSLLRNYLSSDIRQLDLINDTSLKGNKND